MLSPAAGNGLESDIRTFTTAGANRVLIKPFDVDDFHSAMAGIVLMGHQMSNGEM